MSGEEPAPQMAPVESPQMDAIKSSFGGNVESKKMQKTILKQQFENFFVSDTEGLYKAYDRFQKLISLLEVHGATVSNEYANQKFLRALPSSWNNIAFIMRNKEGYEFEKYSDDEDANGTNHAEDADETNHSDLKLVKRCITRLYKFHMEYGKPGGIKIRVTFDVLNRVSGLHRALFLSFLGDLVHEHIGLKILSWKKVDKESRDKLYDEITEKSDRGKMARSKNVYHHKMGRCGYVFVKEKMIENKEIEVDEEPPRGIIWLKGRKEADDKIKDGTLNLDNGTDAMTVVFGKEKGGYARGVGSGVTYKRRERQQKDVLVEKLSTEMIEKDVLVKKLSNEMKKSKGMLSQLMNQLVAQGLQLNLSSQLQVASNEDHVQQISTSVFVTNFPEHFTSQDLWRVCGDYGKLIDVYILNTRSKSGKRYGFVRFVKITEVDCLIENPCTIWMARLRLHVNVVRFQRPSLNYVRKDVSINVGKRPSHVKPWSFGFSGKPNSYAFAVKQGKLDKKVEEETKHFLVLDELCILERDFSLSLMGKLKDFDSISNIKKVFAVEGFENIKISYMGGKVYWVRAIEISGWALDFVKEDEDENETDDDNLEEGLNEVNDELRKEKIVEDVTDDEEIPKIVFDQEDLDSSKKEPHCDRQDDAHSSDSFNLYDLLKKNKKHDDGNGDQRSEDTLKFPPGFTRKDDTNVYSKSLNKSEGEFEEGMNEVSGFLTNREVIVMGDFNEVSTQDERYGLVFNVQGTDAFNLFISSSGLVEVPLDGCSFTWCHKSASKMSKIDRFLISKGLMESCPNISGITLGRYLSDHRPILLRESSFDYGPIPLCFFHSWFIKKLKNLKEKTRSWIKVKNDSSKTYKRSLKGKLAGIEALIDKGDANSDILNQHFPFKLSLDQQADMERDVSMEEIKRAVWDCGLDKSPGPDGFNFGFYRRYWGFLECDVVEAVTYFFQYGSFPKGGNSSFIALIMKMQDAKLMKDFRPIRLIVSLYKIISKILANRMVVVLGEIVNEVQSVFDVNRQILDGPFILDELLNWCKNKKKESMIFKVDFEKAYDSVRWDYLDNILKKFGFDAGLFKGVIIGVSLQLSHLFYADDVVFIEVEMAKVDRAAQKIGCMTFRSPFSYLEIKVGGSMSRTNSWNEIVNKLLMRLSKWKMKTLSIGGRLTLIVEYNVKKPMWVKWNNVFPSKEKGDIVRDVVWMKNKGIDMLNYLRKKVGNWAETLFWEDVWRGDVAFKMLYPIVYSLETVKNISVTFKLSHEDMGSSLHRSSRGGAEQAQFSDMCDKVVGTFIAVMRDR
nr:RNA-directed DNA polymerase, eukaryota, reverse transcriptase zinc-binding domain protein [Tanacetum cinerariifolium]